MLVLTLLSVSQGHSQSFEKSNEYLALGIESYQSGDFDKAIQFLGIAIARGFGKDANFIQAHVHLGLSHLAYGKTKEARTTFRRAIERQPEFELDAERYPPKAVSLFTQLHSELVSELTMHTQPPAADVWLDKEMLGNTGEAGSLRRQNLLVGRYKVRVTKQHYNEANTEIEILPAQPNQLNVTLEPRMIALHLSSDPSGATVWVDGKVEGETPIPFSRQAGIQVQVECKLPYYQPEDFSLRFDDEEVFIDDAKLPVSRNRVAYNLTLKPVPTGSLAVSTDPPGAALLIDGDLHEQTPTRVTDLAAGNHLIGLYLDAYENLEQQVEISSNKELTLHFVLGGTLQIECFPTGADLFAGGKLIGEAPLETGALPLGEVLLRAEKPGFFPAKQVVSIPGRGVHEARFALVPETGALDIRTVPPGATLFVDGVERGVTPALLAHLPTGTHELRLVKDGYKRWNVHTNIPFGEIVWRNICLKPELPSAR